MQAGLPSWLQSQPSTECSNDVYYFDATKIIYMHIITCLVIRRTVGHFSPSFCCKVKTLIPMAYNPPPIYKVHWPDNHFFRIHCQPIYTMYSLFRLSSIQLLYYGRSINQSINQLIRKYLTRNQKLTGSQSVPIKLKGQVKSKLKQRNHWSDSPMGWSSMMGKLVLIKIFVTFDDFNATLVGRLTSTTDVTNEFSKSIVKIARLM